MDTPAVHRDPLKVRIKLALLGRLIPLVLRCICTLIRTQKIGWERYEVDDKQLIFCGWHGKSLLFAHQFRKRNYWVIISNSNDGDIQNANFQRLGFNTIRGSTGRGGVKAALQAIKVLKNGGTMAVTPDGPRGPSHEIQGGVMMMAQKSGCGLVPVGIEATPAIRLGTWDKYMIPIIFGRARMVFGEPIYVAPEDTLEQVETKRQLLQNEINRMEALAAFPKKV